MEIYQALQEDHRNLIHILERLDGTSADASKLRRELLDDLELQLLSHAAAEEEVFLGLLKERDETRDPAFEISSEMKDAIGVLRHLIQIGSKNDHWEEEFARLRGLIESHIDEDEKTMFPRAKRVLNTDSAEEMGEKFDDIKCDYVDRNQLN